MPNIISKLNIILTSLLFSLSIARPVAAHVVWIEPSAFLARTGEQVDLVLRVGEAFVGDSLIRVPDWFTRFSVFHDGEERPVVGDMGDDPAGNITLRSPGGYLALYENKPNFVELKPEKFHSYLRNNGLEAILDQRQELGEFEETAGEYYSRCAKTVISTTGKITNASSVETGCTLDLMLTELSTDETTSTKFRLLYEGKAIENVLIVGITKESPQQKLTGRTDANGLVQFPSLNSGTWLFSAVHMIREEKDQAKWRSYWASITFKQPVNRERAI